MEPQQPQRLGKYEIIAKIGQGAMGDVYKAHDPILNRDVAIKTMSASIGSDEELRKRFHREAQAAARLNHPGIVSVYDFGEEGGKIYMAMELLEGKDLRALVGKVPMSLDRKLDIILQVCDAMSFAHAKEVVHRDLKPGNIHIQPNGQIKIMDFGLARLASSEMTRTGMVMGTPNYMSPEQVRGERADSRSDVFSLGAVFYEILANRKPFEADSLHAVLFQVMQGEPEPLENLVPDLPQEVVDIIRAAMSKDPVQRYTNAGEMADALRQVTGQISQPATLMGDATVISSEPSAGPASRPPGSRPPSTVGSVALRNRPASHAPRSTVMPRQPRTLAGQARTHVPQGASAADATALAPPPVAPTDRTPSSPPVPRRQAASPMPIVIGGALVLALGVGGAVVLLRKPTPEPVPTPDSTAVQALSQELIANKVQLAQKSLDDKNWDVALSEAQAVLKEDASNSAAQQVASKAQAMIAQVQETVGRGRAALNSGNMEGVATALEQLLALDPDNPAAAEFTLRLNKGFRSQAESAKGAMAQSEQGAVKARASNQPDFKIAAELGGAGEDLFKRGQYAEAARKYLEARDAYGRAQRAAERPTPPPATQPRPTLPPATQSAATLPPATQPPATLPPTTQPAATLAPATPPPITQPPTTQPPLAGEEAAVRRVVADYKRAIVTKDVGLLKSLKPDLSGREEQGLKMSTSKEVDMDIATVRMEGNKATVMVLRKDRTTDGRDVQLQQTLMLEKTSGGWIIKRIAAQQIGQ
ncbi:MAG TPA: protein kinase [Vicinamibacteria bacterium]|nr:protein kinase [Vicinamibacteria bacterium]